MFSIEDVWNQEDRIKTYKVKLWVYRKSRIEWQGKISLPTLPHNLISALGMFGNLMTIPATKWSAKFIHLIQRESLVMVNNISRGPRN